MSEAPHQADAGQSLPDQALVEVGPEVLVIEAVVGVDRARALLMLRSYHPHNIHVRAAASLVRAVCCCPAVARLPRKRYFVPRYARSAHATRSGVADRLPTRRGVGCAYTSFYASVRRSEAPSQWHMLSVCGK